MSKTGLITHQSAHNFETTLERLLTVLQNKGITVFARIDHAAGAASAGLALRRTTLVVFGNPTAGTPLMQAGQTAGIDLPLKALIWEDVYDTVNLTYNDPAWVADRHALGAGVEDAVAAMSAALEGLAQHATGS